MVRAFLAMGIGRLIFQSGQEPAIMALKREAAEVLREDHGVTVMLRESPVAESQSNGVVETAACDIGAGAVFDIRHLRSSMG